MWLSSIQRWIDCTLHVTDVQSAPIIITLLVFITGAVSRSIWSFIVNVSKRTATRRQFFLLIQHMAVGCDRQAKGYIETAKSFNMQGLKPFSASVADFYQPGVIKDIGYSEVYNSIFSGIENWCFFRLWRRRRKKEAFHLCWKAIDGVKSWQDKGAADMKFVIDYYNSHNEQRNSELRKFEELSFNLVFAIGGDPNADYARAYVNDVMRIKDALNKMENSSAADVVHENLVKPVLAISESHMWREAQKVRFCLTDAFVSYENMNRMLGVYRSQFGKYAKQFFRYRDDIVNGRSVIGPIVPKRYKVLRLMVRARE